MLLAAVGGGWGARGAGLLNVSVHLGQCLLHAVRHRVGPRTVQRLPTRGNEPRQVLISLLECCHAIPVAVAAVLCAWLLLGGLASAVTASSSLVQPVCAAIDINLCD